MALAGMEQTQGREVALRRYALPLAFVLCCLAVILVDLADGQLYWGDNDDIVRALQIRDLLADNQWFDLCYPFVSMPETYVSHYSRLVDLPYFALSWTLTPLFGADRAFVLATHLVPLALFAGFCGPVLYALGRIAGRRLSATDVVFAVLAMPLAIFEFSPGRIDHHNFQLVLMMLLMSGLLARRAVAGGVMMGASTAVSVAIGLEGIPYVVVAFAGLSFAAGGGVPKFQRKLILAGASLAVLALPATILSYGPQNAFQTHYDAASAPWITMMVVGGLVLACVPALWTKGPFARGNRTWLWIGRMASLAVPSFAVFVYVGMTFPDFLGGYYDVVDPLSRHLWLDRIPQEKSVLFYFAGSDRILTMYCTLWAFIVLAAVPRIRMACRERQFELVVAFGVAVAAFPLFLGLERTVPFAAVMVSLFVPAAVDLFRARPSAIAFGGVTTGRWLTLCAVVSIAGVGAAYIVAPGNGAERSVLEQMSADDCKEQSLDVLDHVSAGRVMAPFGVALRIAQEKTRFSVPALPLHRAAPGMHRMFTAFTSHEPGARAAALAPFDYVAVCARNTRLLDSSRAPLFTALAREESVHGIVRIELDDKSAFHLYRIDHAAFR